jgi:hypothetical protein
MEDVGPSEDRQCREVSAEGPSTDPDLLQVEESEPGRGGVEGVDLVLQHRAGEIAVDGVLPGDAAPRRAPAIRDEDREPLIGEPLGLEERSMHLDHAREVGTPVGVEEHRQRGIGFDTVGGEEGDPDVALADHRERRPRLDHRRLGE